MCSPNNKYPTKPEIPEVNSLTQDDPLNFVPTDLRPDVSTETHYTCFNCGQYIGEDEWTNHNRRHRRCPYIKPKPYKENTNQLEETLNRPPVKIIYQRGPLEPPKW